MGTKQNHERRGNMPWELECPNTINIIRCLKHLIWSVIRLNPGPDFDSNKQRILYSLINTNRYNVIRTAKCLNLLQLKKFAEETPHTIKK